MSNLVRMDPKLRRTNDAEFLHWIADRIVYIYGESPNVDFVLKLREIANNKYLINTTDNYRE